MHPDFYTGQRMVKPPVVYNAGPAADAGRVHQQRRSGGSLGQVGRPAALLPARRRRLGLHALARTRRRSAPAGSWRRSCRAREHAGRARRATRRSSSSASIQFWGYPTVSPRRRTCSPPSRRRSSTRQNARPDRRDRDAADCSPPPPTSRPHELRTAATATAPSSSAARSPRRAAACRRSSRACRSRPAPGSRGATFLSRTRRARARRLRRRRRSSALALDDGIAAAAATRRPARTSSSRSSSPAAIDGAVGALPGRRPALLPAAGRTRARSRRRASPTARTAGSRWNPAATSIATLHDEGKVSVDAGDRLRQLRPVALHLAPLLGGRRDRRRPAHRLARPLPRRGRHRRQPAAGPLARRRAPAGARDREGAGGDDPGAPTSTPSCTPGLPPHPLESSMLQEAANIGARSASSTDAGLADGRRDRRLESHHLASELGQLHLRAQDARSPTRSRPIPFPHRLAGLAAMIAAGLPLRVVTITSPGHFDTHADQAGDAHERAAADLRLAARLPARPRGARGRRPGADPRLVGVRPPRRRERLGRHRPRLGRDRVPDRHAGHRPADRRRSRASPAASTPTATSIPTADFRAVYSAILEQWLGADANQHPAGRLAPTSGRRCSSEGRCRRGARGGGSCSSPPPPRPPRRPQGLPDPGPGRRRRSSTSPSRAGPSTAGPGDHPVRQLRRGPARPAHAARRRRAHRRHADHRSRATSTT